MHLLLLIDEFAGLCKLVSLSPSTWVCNVMNYLIGLWCNFQYKYLGLVLNRNFDLFGSIQCYHIEPENLIQFVQITSIYSYKYSITNSLNFEAPLFQKLMFNVSFYPTWWIVFLCLFLSNLKNWYLCTYVQIQPK